VNEHDEESAETQYSSASVTDAGTSNSYRELVPVPASVFDDDFFRRPTDTDRQQENWGDALQPARNVDADSRGQLHADSRVPTFSGYATSEPEAATDELDIPAFLRRNH